MCTEQAGVVGESQQGPKLTIRLRWSEQGGLGRAPPVRDLAEGGQGQDTQSQWVTGAGAEPISVHLLPPSESCPMQLPAQLTAHTRCSISVAIEPCGMY